jgi:hypothetical protein
LSETASRLLLEWVSTRLDAPRRAWLTEQVETLERDPSDGALHLAMGLCPRQLGPAALALTAAELSAAEATLPGWQPRGWSLADAARIALLARVSHVAPANPPPVASPFAARFRTLCATADVAELTALYRGLPLYAHGETLLAQVGEGLRSNMRSVFEAIAHGNPYPRLHFDEHRWNHMVLKALFVGSALAPIQGLDARANAELARMMCDFAHERRAAGRPVPFEIWRCVGPFATGPMIDDLAVALGSADPTEQAAAALGLAACRDPAAQRLLQGMGTLKTRITNGQLTWATLPSA